MQPNPKGVMEKNNKLMMKMDKERRNSSGYKAQLSKSKALSKAKK